MNAWLLIRRMRGPAFLIMVGITALLDQWGVLRFSRSWPLYPGAYAGSVSGSGLPAADPLADPNRRA